MRYAPARGEFLLGLVHVSEEFELFNEFLVRSDVHENRCSPTVLRKENGPPPALNLPHDARNVGAGLRERPDVFARSRLRHASDLAVPRFLQKESAAVQRLALHLPPAVHAPYIVRRHEGKPRLPALIRRRRPRRPTDRKPRTVRCKRLLCGLRSCDDASHAFKLGDFNVVSSTVRIVQRESEADIRKCSTQWLRELVRGSARKYDYVGVQEPK